MIYLKTSVGIEIRDEDLLISSLQSNLSAGVFTHFTRVRNFRSRDRAEVRREIDGFFRSRRLSRDSVVLGIQRRNMVLRHLDLPAEVTDNLKQVVQYQVQSFEPTEEEKFYYDFALLRGSKNGKRITVLLAMVKKSMLDADLELLRELGVRPVVVTGGSLGLINLFLHNRREPAGKTFFIADVGAAGLEILAVRDGALVYTRDSDKENQRTWKELLVTEIDLAAGKIGLGPEDTIEQILLAGENGSSAQQEIAEDVPDCSLIDQTIRYEMPAENRHHVQVAATSLGLALTGLIRRPQVRLNLLPTDLRIKRTRWAYVPTIVLGLAIIVLLAALGFRQLFQEQILARKLDAEITNLTPRVDRIKAVKNQAETLEKKLTFMEGLLKQRDMNLELLQELTTVLPSDTFLTVYNNKDGSIQLSGSATSAPDLIPKLEKSPMLKDVVQRGTVFRDVQTGKDRFNFEAKLER